jgi:RNA polymerase sigma factor (sigma-70 family)
MRKGVQSADAPEVVQDVFRALHASVRRLDPEDRIRPWLMGVLKKRLARYFRDQRRNRAVGGSEARAILEAAPGSDDPASAVARQEEQQRDRATMAKALESVRDRLAAEGRAHAWAAFELRSLQGLTLEETSTSTGLSVATVWRYSKEVQQSVEQAFWAIRGSRE